MNYFSTLHPRNTPTSINAQDNLLVIRERILHQTFLALSILGIFGYPIILVTSIQQHSWQIAIFFSFAYIFFLYFSGVFILIRSGLNGYGSIFMIAVAIFLTIMVGIRAGVGSSILAIITMLTIGWLMSSARLAMPSTSSLFNSGNILDWLLFSGIFMLVTGFFISLLRLLIVGLEQTIQKQINLTNELKRERNQLDSRIHQRTNELQKRASQLEVAGLVARDISKAANLDEILNNSVQLIKDRFNFYHAGIFLLDENKEYAVLRAATGEAGRRMIENNHKLKSGETGIVGYVVEKGEAHIALDVNIDEVHFKNPFLSQTRSEMALPLKVGNVIIGALDVQSVEENAFGYEDVQTLQTIADQLAVAIEKANLMQRLQETD